MDDVRLTPGLVTLLSLAGTWSGAGTAELPAMEAIAFEEEIRFTRRSATSLDYWQRARAQADGSMLHSESGIWRTMELGTLEVSVALPGATEVRRARSRSRRFGSRRPWLAVPRRLPRCRTSAQV